MLRGTSQRAPGLGGDERAGESRREEKQGGVGAVLSVGVSGAGTELSFDYGVGYWAGREDDPAPGTDSRLAAIRVRRAVGATAPFLRAVRWCLPL